MIRSWSLRREERARRARGSARLAFALQFAPSTGLVVRDQPAPRGGKEVLRQAPAVFQAMFSDLSEDWMAEDEGPDTWSPYRVVGHLTHIDECDWIDRTRVILDHGTERTLQPVDREAGFTCFRAGRLAIF
jgi:hypothetical protein